MDEKIKTEEVNEVSKKPSLVSASFSDIVMYNDTNPWINFKSNRDLLEVDSLEKAFHKAIKDCRFFYERDPIASTTIDKLVDIGITNLTFESRNLSKSIQRIFDGILDDLHEFAEQMAMEYLISGLVVPEIKYTRFSKQKLNELGIKNRNTLMLPEVLWLRDPATIKISKTVIMDKPSYFVKVPEELVIFIQNKGRYSDNSEDRELYRQLVRLYPEFVIQVQKGNKEIFLENNFIFSRKRSSYSPYPKPYLYSSLEAMKHKRNLRRMDYSIASRVISAIQVFKLGSDEFPVTEGEEDAFTDLKNEIRIRNTTTDYERIFQLFANHTLQIEWIFPPTEALLDDAKYKEVNSDILFGLGFPRILITGEASRTGTSDASLAVISPHRTMEAFRKKILLVLNKIANDILKQNRLNGETKISFTPLNLHKFEEFVTAMIELYNTGNISRHTLDDALGFNFDEEINKKKEENELLEKLSIEEFAPVPHSNAPNVPGNGQPPDQKEQKPKEKE